MRVRHFALGKFNAIECLEGTRVVRRPDAHTDGEADCHDILVVPLRGQEIHIPADPPELLPMLAESGNFGTSLADEPVPEGRLARVICPGCGETDITWLQLRDRPEAVHCDGCAANFELEMPAMVPAPDSSRS